MWETWVWSLGGEDPLEKEMATHSNILAWNISWTEEPGGLQCMGTQRGNMTEQLMLSFMMKGSILEHVLYIVGIFLWSVVWEPFLSLSLTLMALILVQITGKSFCWLSLSLWFSVIFSWLDSIRCLSRSITEDGLLCSSHCILSSDRLFWFVLLLLQLLNTWLRWWPLKFYIIQLIFSSYNK